jgi:hypothetical protein
MTLTGLPIIAQAQPPPPRVGELRPAASARSILDESTHDAEPQAGERFSAWRRLAADPAPAATTTIAIDVPAGRNGATPRLAVTYSSNGGNGLFGVGWNLAVGQIRRCTREGTPFEYDNNPADPFRYPVPGDAIAGDGDFILDLHGAQLRLDCYLGYAGNGYYAYGSLARKRFCASCSIRAATSGSSPTSRALQQLRRRSTAEPFGWNVNSATGTFAWAPHQRRRRQRQLDHHLLRRARLSGSLNRFIYPQRDYGANANSGAANLFSVTWSYAAVDGQQATVREDNPVSYLGGFESRIDYRVYALFVDQGARRLRVYRFNYGYEPTTRVSRLLSVSSRAGTATDLPATQFEYDDAPAGFLPAQNWSVPAQGGAMSAYVRFASGGVWQTGQIDVNGDALPDRVGTFSSTNPPGYANMAWKNTGAGLAPFAPPASWDPGSWLTAPAARSTSPT